MDCVELRVSHESLRRREVQPVPTLRCFPFPWSCRATFGVLDFLLHVRQWRWCTMKNSLLCNSEQGSWRGEERWIWWWCDLMTMPHSFIPSNSTRLNSALDVRNRLGKGCILRCMFGLCNDTRASSTLASREILWSEHQRSHLQVQQLKDTCMTTRGGGYPPSSSCLLGNEDAQREAQSQ